MRPNNCAASVCDPCSSRTRPMRVLSLAVLSTSVLTFIGSITDVFGVHTVQTRPDDLRTVLPDEIPEDLSVQAFDELGTAWEAWSGTTIDQLAALYEERELDAVGQREVLKDLRAKLSELTAAIDDPNNQAIHRPLRTLRDRLRRRVELAEASLDVLEMPESAFDGTAANLTGKLSESLSQANSFLGGFVTGQGWRNYLELDDLGSALSANEVDVALGLCVKLVEKLDPASTDDDDRREFVNREPLQGLGYMAQAWSTVAASDSSTTARRELVIDQLSALLMAVEKYEADNTFGDAKTIRLANTAIRAVSPAAATRLTTTLLPTYMNHNLHVYGTEALIKELATQKRSESGRIDDCVLGAKVDGCQVTDVDTTVDIKPSPRGGILFTFKLNGTTRSSTQARKKPATLFSTGHHRFWVTKNVHFDNFTFTPEPATVTIDPNNTTHTVKTDYDGVFIVGGLVRSIAKKKSRKSKPQSEAITARKLANSVLPEVNQEVADQLAKAHDEIHAMLDPMKPFGLYPQSVDTRSNESFVAFSSRTMQSARLGGSQPASIPQPSEGLAFQIHESLINNFIDGLDLGGRALAEDELPEHIEDRLSQLLGREIQFPTEESDGESNGDDADAEPPATFVFDSSDPIRVQFEDDHSLTLILRMGVRQEGKDDIPTQRVTIPITWELVDGKIVLEAGQAGVRPVKPLRGFREKATQAGRAAQIRRIMEAKLPRREIDAGTEIELEPEEETGTARVIPLAVSLIESAEGWITVWMQ